MTSRYWGLYYMLRLVMNMKKPKNNKLTTVLLIIILIIPISLLSVGIKNNCDNRRDSALKIGESKKDSLDALKILNDQPQAKTESTTTQTCLESLRKDNENYNHVILKKTFNINKNANDTILEIDKNMADQKYVKQSQKYYKYTCGILSTSYYVKDSTRITIDAATYSPENVKCENLDFATTEEFNNSQIKRLVVSTVEFKVNIER